MSTPSLQKIGNGIYAWIGANGDSNAGAALTPNGLLAIDAQQTKALGSSFRSAIETETGRVTTQLIDTHFHLDHTAGNVAFADVPIAAHVKTRGSGGDDRGNTVPLCPVAHDEQEGRTERFEKKYGVKYWEIGNEPNINAGYGWGGIVAVDFSVEASAMTRISEMVSRLKTRIANVVSASASVQTSAESPEMSVRR